MSTETPAPAAGGAERLGKVISGRYLIQQLLGEGGMGSVYLAEHTHMKKRVALKLLHPEMIDNAEVSARFEREALAAAHVVHPNVAGATDFGKTDDGAYFLVLEYVEGTDLRTAIGGGPLSAQRSLRIARQISLALERAHETGIVHRDLKPENVMLVKKEHEPDFVKVLDFGIAKVLEGAASAAADIGARRGAPNAPLTRMGTILGTPEYMAPEQALGEAVTPAADLYAVGVMLYEMLTGRHPFEVSDRMAVLSLHLVAPVPPMQDRAPAVDVPAPIEAIVRCLLEKDAKKRYPSARALIDAIEGAAAGCGIDLGTGAPNAPPSNPGPESALPNWAPRDAFAKTSVGMPVPDTTAAGAAAPARTRESVLTTLGKQPRGVLIALSAALPLGFILVIVIAVLAFRGPKPASDGTLPTAKDDSAEEAKSKAAPADRVAAAMALGPEAIEALVKEYPEDTTLLTKLAVAYQAQGNDAEAMRVVRALVTADPAAARDDALVELVATTATKGTGADDDAAYALLEGPLGERGVDALIELSTRAPGRETRGARDHRVRAAKSLAKPEVREHASAAAAIYLDLKAAQGCGKKKELLERTKADGDARTLPLLKQLKSTRGCGFFGRSDCWSCLRRESTLEETTTAVEARSPAKDAR